MLPTVETQSGYVLCLVLTALVSVGVGILLSLMHLEAIRRASLQLPIHVTIGLLAITYFFFTPVVLDYFIELFQPENPNKRVWVDPARADFLIFGVAVIAGWWVLRRLHPRQEAAT